MKDTSSNPDILPQPHLPQPTRRLFFWLNLALFLLAVCLVPLVTFVFSSPAARSALVRLLLASLAALAGAFFLKSAVFRAPHAARLSLPACLAVSSTLSASLYLLLSYLPDISNSPFTLTWSEASRYYYASLFFSKRIYGQSVPPTVLHPSRYLLQSVPFLIPGSPIWVHRAWQVLLWIVIPPATILVLAARLNIKDRLHRWLFSSMAFLFIMTGPIYYHLLVPVLLVLWGFRPNGSISNRRRWITSLGVVFTASAWAGISRVNWFPLPGSLAALLILLESPIQISPDRSPRRGWQTTVRYLLRLAGWFCFGAAVAFIAQLLYISWSGNSVSQFVTSFSSGLLWHRLLPSATYPLGILPAISLVSLPLALIILGKLIQPLAGIPLWKRFHPVRLLGLLSILAVFFLGGLVVSVKIGGGSNIHNMDAFMALLLVVAAYFLFERTEPDLQPEAQLDPQAEDFSEENLNRPARPAAHRVLTSAGLALGFVIFPLTTFLVRSSAGPRPDPSGVARGLATISEAVQATVQNGGEVLFISYRELLTFHEVEAPLIPDYERVFLMEAAMAGDPEYLARFEDDLKNQRFGLIVSEPISLKQKEASGEFAAENNAWVKNVSRPLLCYYKPLKTLRTISVQLLVPNPDIPTKCR